MTFCALAMKTFWRQESPGHWRWHCFRRAGRVFKSMCGDVERPSSNGQHKWRPPDLQRCTRCATEEHALFERMSGTTRVMSLDESADWRDGIGE